MDKIQEDKLDEVIKEQMQKVRNSAMLAGCKAMCGVILEKANNKKKTDKERLDEIVAFCKRTINIADKHTGENKQ